MLIQLFAHISNERYDNKEDKRKRGFISDADLDGMWK